MFRTVGLFAYTKEIIKKFPLLKSDLEKYEDLEILRFLENNIKVKCAYVKEEISDVNYKSDIKRVENLLRKIKK
jgi:CMP-2-keto-3-deoxyoctulosonic acid synthetase